MILQVMAAKDRRDFEYRLMEVSGEKRRKVFFSKVAVLPGRHDGECQGNGKADAQ